MAAAVKHFFGRKIGHGTFRMTLGIQEHEDALKMSIQKGVKLIDTSAAYGGGLSEQLVAKVLKVVSLFA
jgi:diketogulonate reductase-like aldo/keto reductase